MTEENNLQERERGFFTYLSQLKEMLPILSVVLIFLGYWNLDSYYQSFNIEIYHYLTVSEIMLGFMPLIKEIISFFIVIFFMSLFRAVLELGIEYPLKKLNKRKKVVELESKVYTIRDQALNRLKNRVLKKTLSVSPFQIVRNIFAIFNKKLFFIGGKEGRADNIFFLAIRLICIAFAIALYAIVIYFTTLNFDILSDVETLAINKHQYVSNLLVALFFVSIWILFFINEHLEVLHSKSFLFYYVITCILIFGTYATSRVNSYEAKIVLYGQSTTRLNLTTGNNIVTIDSNLAFIGQTQNYIFLRSLFDSTNHIYSMNDIEKIEYLVNN